MVQGLKGVRDTVSHYIPEAVIINNKSDLTERREWDGMPLFTASESEIRKISTLENLPEIIAIYRIPEINIDLKVERSNFYLALDDIQDPGNLGTILRTAHWFGVKTIFCSRGTVDLYNPKVVQSTMGSISKVSVCYCDLEALFSENQGIPVYGLVLDGKNIFEQKNFKPGFILMGSEGHGPKESSLKYVTESLTIPPSDPLDYPDSLNVGVATAITLAQMIK